MAACKLQCSVGSDRHEVEDGSLRSLAGVIEPFSIAVENFAPSVDDRRRSTAVNSLCESRGNLVLHGEFVFLPGVLKVCGISLT